MRRVCVVVGVIGVLACGGGDEKPPFVVKGPPDNHRDASFEEIVDAGGGSSDAGNDAAVVTENGPLLEFTAPTAAVSPTDDTLITSREVIVRCRVKPRPGQAAVDGASVKITLEKEDGTTRVSAPTDPVSGDEYQAKFELSTRSNGPLRFHCEAKDLAKKPEFSSVALDTLLDLGPKIQLFTPKDKGVYARKTPVLIQFQVDPAPVGDGDSEAEIKQVRLQVSGAESDIPVTETADRPGFYQANVDFGDTTLFKMLPTSAELVITAVNGRTPEAEPRVVKANIVIDAEGPTIAVTSPADDALVPAKVTLKVNVTDMAGVAPRSLKAVINKTLLVISDWEVKGSVYEATFDLRSQPEVLKQLTQLTINITATDLVGNERTKDLMLRLDSLPPVLSLDPPLARERNYAKDGTYCSTAFDPVGEWATSDRERVTVSSLYRVLVEDDAIVSPGAITGYLAGVKRTSVELFVQPDPAVPLLIDSSGDGICDEINLEELPIAQRPEKVSLSPVTPRGAAWYPKSENFDASNPGHNISVGGYCEADPAGADMRPNTLCSNSEMRRVLAGRSSDKPPAVYALNPTNGSGLACTGDTWNELLLHVGEGWACLAARAMDNVENVGISEAIRVCFDADWEDGNDPCTDPPPNCNKNCAISDAQRFLPLQFWRK